MKNLMLRLQTDVLGICIKGRDMAQVLKVYILHVPGPSFDSRHPEYSHPTPTPDVTLGTNKNN